MTPARTRRGRPALQTRHRLVAPARLNRIAVAICTLFLLLFVLLSYSAVRGKSPTFDEPVQALGAWANLHLHDYRINFEDPPLWKYWAALPNSTASITFNGKDHAWEAMSDDVYLGWELANRTLFQTPGNDGAAFINRSRFMMVLLGCGLGIILTIWAWQIGGPMAAMITAGLYSLDPNLIGHAGLVKNDVALGLMLLAVFHACWRAGRALTIPNAAAIAILMAVAVNTKFSALLLLAMLAVVFAIRAALPGPWMVLGRNLNGMAARAAAAAALLATVAGVCVFGIWASYGFRWNPAPDPGIQLNTRRHALEAAQYRFQAEHPQPPVPAFDPVATPLSRYVEELNTELGRYRELLNDAGSDLPRSALSPASRDRVSASLVRLQQSYDQLAAALERARAILATTPARDPRAGHDGDAEFMARQLAYASRASALNKEYNLRLIRYYEEVGDTAPDAFIGLVNVLLDHHLLPSAWLHGVLFVHARSMVRSSYLLGETSATGWWYYFPLAMLFKTPVGTLLAFLMSFVLGVRVIARRRREMAFIWTAACVAVPFTIHLGWAMGSNLNIGLRHILPVYPLMYLGAGVLLATAIERVGRPVAIAAGVCGALVAAESLSAFPNYIAYFNAPASAASRQGLDLLADSNLDWGQDLPLLAAWQQHNPNVRLAFGPAMHLESASGSYFGTVDPEYYGIKADPLYLNQPNVADIERTHVLAISATYLQGVYGGPFASFKDRTPLAVLGGTIYLYTPAAKRD